MKAMTEPTMEMILKNVAHKLSLQAAKLLVYESVTSPHPLLTNVFQAMLEARLLPLLEAGQAMRNYHDPDDSTLIDPAAREWDVAKAKAVKP